jgi:class 3 adenylate cyclase
MCNYSYVCHGSTSRPLGALAHLLGRFEEAEQHFEEALESYERASARPLAAQARIEYARMLRDRAGPGDAARALELVNHALAAAQEIGMAAAVREALALKLELQGVGSGEAQGSIHVVSSAVQERRPDLAPHAAPDGTVTLMFSDMEGFTEMTEQLGDLRAREVIREHNAIVRKQLRAHGGYEVELQGDGFLLAFGSARQALRCAIEIQRAFAARNSDADRAIRVRIGLHTGEALKDAEKFFGRTVILAARIASQAAGGEILASSILRELTRSLGDLRFGAEREVDLKGISERQRVHAVEWE